MIEMGGRQGFVDLKKPQVGIKNRHSSGGSAEEGKQTLLAQDQLPFQLAILLLQFSDPQLVRFPVPPQFFLGA